MMKKLSGLFLLIILSMTVHGQRSKMNFAMQRNLLSEQSSAREISVLVKGDPAVIRTQVENLGGDYKFSTGDISCVKISLSKIRELAKVSEVKRIESSEYKLQPMNDQMVVNNHVLEVQNGFGLPQAYNGEGVVIGIIDEGIDFTHPDFRDEFGNTRIKYLWDQAIINTDPNTQPQPYGYGKEYVGSQIDTSTQHHDSPFGHGSHVAGIACGNGLAVNNYKGVAPKADMIIVKSNLNQPDAEFLTSLVEAVKYIFDKADQMGEPAVINISLGTYFGSHDAKDIQAQSIDNLIDAAPGHVVVCSAGNAGTAPLHLGYELSTDTNFTWLQQSSNSIYIQAWGDSADFENANFSLDIQRIRPDYSRLASLPFKNILSYPDSVFTDTLWSGTNRLGVVQSYAQNFGDRYSFEYMIYPDSSVNINGTDTSRYFWKFRATGSGRLDAWSYDMVFDNLPDSLTMPEITKYKMPDTDQTIVSSFSCSDKVITVGSYINRNYYTNVNYAITRDTTLHVGELSTFSSHGPTRDGRIKPDITATGEWVLSCSTQAELNILAATEPDKVAAGKKHKRSSGTSMSSPVVAGIAALYLQKKPSANWQDVKNAIIGCAGRDQFTGSSLPDNNWGYGKVDGYGVVKGCSIGIDELQFTHVDLSFFPNPSHGQISIQYDLTTAGRFHKAVLEIYDIIGKTVRTIPLTGISNSIQIDLSQLPGGMYTGCIKIDGEFAKAGKIVIE